MSGYNELVARLREEAAFAVADRQDDWADSMTQAADAIESLLAENGRLRRALEAERESLRLAADEGLRPW